MADTDFEQALAAGKVFLAGKVPDGTELPLHAPPREPRVVVKRPRDVESEDEEDPLKCPETLESEPAADVVIPATPPPSEPLDPAKCRALRMLTRYESLVDLAHIVLAERDEIPAESVPSECTTEREVSLLLHAVTRAESDGSSGGRPLGHLNRARVGTELLTKMWTSDEPADQATLEELASYMSANLRGSSHDGNVYGPDGRWTIVLCRASRGHVSFKRVMETLVAEPKWRNRCIDYRGAPDRAKHLLIWLHKVAKAIADFLDGHFFEDANGRVAALVLAWTLERNLRLGVPPLIPLSGPGYERWCLAVRHAQLYIDHGPMIYEILETVRHATRQSLRFEYVELGPDRTIRMPKRRRDADDYDETGQPVVKAARPLVHSSLVSDD